MPRFKTQVIKRSNPAGVELAQARQGRHLSLSQVARRLKIPVDYIAALEAGEWETLPQGDYGRYFLRQYAIFLGLDVAEILKQYPGPNLPRVVQPPKGAPVDPSRAVHPLRRLLLLVVALAVVAYLAVAARAIFLPPRLTLVSPSSDGTTSSPTITVAGITQAGTEVTVNNEPVEVTASGRFLAAIALRPGLNTLTVKASKNLSRETTVVRRIFFTPVKAEPGPETESP